MAQDWIETAIEDVKKSDEQRRLNQEMFTRMDRLVEAQAPRIWMELSEQVKTAAESISAGLDWHDSRRIDFRQDGETGFTVSGPTLAVKCSLNLDGRLIALDISTFTDAFHAKRRSEQIQFFFNNGSTAMKVHDQILPTVESATQRIIGLILKSFRSPRPTSGPSISKRIRNGKC